MKKIAYGILLVCVLSFSPSLSAAINIPDEIFLGTSTTYDAGSVPRMTFKESNISIGKKNTIEYGVARTIKQGLFTSFEILTTKVADISGFDQLPGLSVEIPNVSTGSSSEKYVAYIKYYEKNNQDNVGFYYSNEFKINVNSVPFTNIKNINLLHSNGDRFATIHGPTIYTPEEFENNTYLATSTSLEITFESNIETTIIPTIEFSKLRSGVFSKTYTPESIKINKGTTYVVIPLPVFDYEPGVYIGKMSFDEGVLKNTVDLQYIVAGDFVSVGTVSLAKNIDIDRFNFEIFGTPVDMDSLSPEGRFVEPSATSTNSSLYTVTTNMLNSKGETVYSSTQDVDFTKESFATDIPKNKFTKIQIESVYVKVVSPRSGKTLYEGVKKISYVSLPEINSKKILFGVLYVILILLAIFSLFKKSIKTAIVCIVLLTLLFFTRDAFSQSISETTGSMFPLNAYITGYKPTESRLINVAGQVRENHYPKFFFQEDIANKVFTCGTPKKFTFTIRYVACSNTTPIIQRGASITSYQDAIDTRTAAAGSMIDELVGSVYSSQEKKTHYYYNRISEFQSLEIPESTQNPVNLYLHTYHKSLASLSEAYAGNSNYKIPITTGPCSACTNAPSTLNTPNFQAHGRNYYFASADGKLYFRDLAAPSSPSSCGVDMCSETAAAEASIPSGKTWTPATPSYSVNSGRYECLPINVTCSCSGRNRVCNSTVGTSSTEVNHSSCALRAYCSAQYDASTNTGTMLFGASSNLLDTLTSSAVLSSFNGSDEVVFSPTANPIIIENLPVGDIYITGTIKDSFDNAVSSATCKLDAGTGVTTTDLTKSSIIKFYANPKVIIPGGVCRFGWQTQHMNRCSIDSVSVATNTTAGDVANSLEITSSDGEVALPDGDEGFPVKSSKFDDKNIVKTLTCVGNSTAGVEPVYTERATCYINPRLQEN